MSDLPNLDDAIVLHKAGKLALAKEKYVDAIKLQPKNAIAYHNLGILFGSLGELEKALECFLKAMEFNGANVEVWRNYIRALVFAKKTSLAHTVTLELFQIIKNPQIFSALGFSSQKNLELIDKIDAALPLSGDIDGATEISFRQVHFLRDLFERNELSDLELKINNLLGFYPHSALLYNIYAIMKKRIGRLDEAILLFKKAIDINSRIPDIHGNLASTYLTIDLVDLALEHYYFQKELSPLSNMLNLARILQEKGCHAEAVAAVSVNCLDIHEKLK